MGHVLSEAQLPKGRLPSRLLLRDEADFMAGRARDELRGFKLEPGAATLAAHLVHVLHRDPPPLLFVHLYPAVHRGWRCRSFKVSPPAELREVTKIGGPFLHDRIRAFQGKARNTLVPVQRMSMPDSINSHATGSARGKWAS